MFPFAFCVLSAPKLEELGWEAAERLHREGHFCCSLSQTLPPEIKSTLHRAAKMQLPLGRSRHLVHWILSHCLSLLAELLCKLQAMTTSGWRSRKPSLVQNPCPFPRLSTPCLHPRLQPWQHCQGFSLVAGTLWKLLPASARAPCQKQGATSPYLNEKFPAQRVVVLIGEDL